jgi:hypothetical protein
MNREDAKGAKKDRNWTLRLYLKDLLDTDNTDYTDFHGISPLKKALFRVVREIRVQKRKRQGLKNRSLSGLAVIILLD